MSSFADKMRQAMQILCPFCKKAVPAPSRMTKVFTAGGCLAERCSCGAAYAVDETGRLGGYALLDAQAVLCDGDLDLATALEAGKQIDVRSQPCRSHAIEVADGRLARTAASARVWFVRRRVPSAPTHPERHG